MGPSATVHVPTADPRSREVIRNACKAVGSISSTAFDIRFNPDIFSPGKQWGGWYRSTGGRGRTSGVDFGPRCPSEHCHACPSDIFLTPALPLPSSGFSPLSPAGVRFPESCQDEVRDQKQLLKDAAAFLLSCQIPGLVREGLQRWARITQNGYCRP